MTIHYKMDRRQRAKQFAPFDALDGFREALRSMEKIIVPKVELTDERKEELDSILRSLKKNQTLTVIYYDNDNYVQFTGIVTKIDPHNAAIRITEQWIRFENIRDIIL